MNFARGLLWIASAIMAATSAWAGPVQARLLQRVNEESQPPRLELVFYFYRDGAVLQDCIRKTAALTDPANYEVVVLKDGKPIPFVIEKVKAPATDGWCSKVILQQKPGEKLSADLAYHARVRDPHVWQFRDGVGASANDFIYANAEGGASPDPNSAATNVSRQKLNEQWLTKIFAYENKLALGAGEHGSTATLSWRLFFHDNPEDYTRYDSYRIELSAKADLNFPAKQRKFLDQVHAEGNLFWSNRWGKSGDAWRLYTDFGAHGFLDADQEFENIDGGGGTLLRWTLGNPLTDFLANGLDKHPNPLLGDHRTAVVSPMFSVGYNYVSHLKDNAASDSGNNRLDLSFFWRWPLAREMKWPHVLGVDADYDLDLRTELGGAYDIDRGDFHDLSRITLELTPTERLPDAGVKNLPTITLTYANGEVSPRYEHVKEWLAGFKYRF